MGMEKVKKKKDLKLARINILFTWASNYRQYLTMLQLNTTK